MIARSSIKTASDEVKARAKGFHAYERGRWVYVITESDKEDRGVLFEGPNGLRVRCFSAETGEECPANTFGSVCCHSFAADRRKRINAKSRATRAGKRSLAA